MKKALVIMTLVVVLSFILTAYFIVNKKVEYNLNRSTGYTIVNIDNSSNYNNSNVEKTIKLYKEYHQNIVDDVTGTNSWALERPGRVAAKSSTNSLREWEMMARFE